MKRRFSKEEDDDIDQFPRKHLHDDESNEPASKSNHLGKVGKKKKDGMKEEYKCGNTSCNKLYHSYTAFYNHCKKTHDGEFPGGSLVNNKPFEGPSKNRGRPRITKTETKNDKEIQAMKSENELIEFLGTINRGEKTEEVIVYVENPLDHVNRAIQITRNHYQANHPLLDSIADLNRVICEHDLPEFYDPIQSEQTNDKVDSYSFSSIIKFLSDPENRRICGITNLNKSILKELTAVWLGRVVSVDLLSDIIWVLMQQRLATSQLRPKQDCLLQSKTKEFLDKVSKFVNCYCNIPEFNAIPEGVKVEH